MIQHWSRVDQTRVLSNKNDLLVRFVTKKEPRDYSDFLRTDHVHDDMVELTLVLSGTGYYSINDYIYSIKKGDLILCNSKTNHSDVLGDSNNLTTICIAMTNVHISSFPENTIIHDDRKPVISLNNEDFQRLSQIFELCFEQLSGRNLYAEEICNASAAALIVIVLQIMNQLELESVYRKEHPLLTSAIKYINENLYEDLSLDRLAKDLHFSKYYLSHFFKAQTGYTPLQYIMRRRIGEAQSLLLSTNLSVTEIATKVGFNNSNQFYVQFKKYIGISPTQFRKHYRSI